MTLSLKPLARRPVRLLLGTLTMALAAGLAQTAFAQPHPGMGGGMSGGMGMGMAFGGDPRHMSHLLDSVGVSPDQKTQIQQIMQAAHKDLKAIHASGRALHQQAQALFTQPTVDANAAEALRQQMLGQHDQASKRMLQAMLDISRVLTVDQRVALSSKMSQMRSLMEKQRAEREAIVGGSPER